MSFILIKLLFKKLKIRTKFLPRHCSRHWGDSAVNKVDKVLDLTEFASLVN